MKGLRKFSRQIKRRIKSDPAKYHLDQIDKLIAENIEAHVRLAISLDKYLESRKMAVKFTK